MTHFNVGDHVRFIYSPMRVYPENITGQVAVVLDPADWPEVVSLRFPVAVLLLKEDKRGVIAASPYELEMDKPGMLTKLIAEALQELKDSGMVY